MGKDLKGKNLGKGITQRKDDGKYQARFVSKTGVRQQARFDTVVEARNWRDKAIYEDKYGDGVDSPDMTVDEWYFIWNTELNKDLSSNTRRNYADRYLMNIQPVIGKMKLCDVKPMHCKQIFNRMAESEKNYAGSTIRQAYITLGTMFKAARMNGKIKKHPLDEVKFSIPARKVGNIKFFTVEEQQKFLAVAQTSHNYYQYAFLLETGLRTGEMIGLTWDNIDWKQRTLTVDKSLEFRHKQNFWRVGPPKTKTSKRTIWLTQPAYEILRTLYAERNNRKQSQQLDEVLEFKDPRTNEKRTLVMRDLVFINFRTGMPNKNSSYDTHLYKLCDKAGIKRVCMHALRHTYATRAIENGMPPKILQNLLGHASLKTTMDTYVHVTDDSLEAAVRQFEEGQRANGLCATTKSDAAT